MHCGGLAAHLGQDKTISLIEERFYWPKLRTAIAWFFELCLVCQTAKSASQNTGLCTPLPIPSLHIILGLHKTPKHVDSIFIVVDRYSKMAHFIAHKRTEDASHVAILFFHEIIRLHGISKTITSNRDVKFVGQFWRVLWKKFSTSLQFSNTAHP